MSTPQEKTSKTVRQTIEYIEMVNVYSTEMSRVKERKRLDRISRVNKSPSASAAPSPQEEARFKAETKFEYAMNKILDRVDRQLKREGGYNEKMQDLNAELGSVDADKNLVYNERGGIKTTSENQKILNKKTRELQKETIEFEPYFATEIPDDLNEMMVQAFKGFIIPEDYELREPGAEVPANSETIPDEPKS